MNGWRNVRPGTRNYEVALFFLLPQHRLRTPRHYFVNATRLVDRFGIHSVDKCIRELNRLYGMGIHKSGIKQYDRVRIWQVGNPEAVFLSVEELKQFSWGMM